MSDNDEKDLDDELDEQVSEGNDSIDSGDETSSEDDDEKERLVSENKELKDRLDDMTDKYIRLAAEFKNYQERSKKEKMRIHSDSIVDAISSIIPIIDDIERVLPSFLDMEEKYSKGVQMILKKISESLKSLGVESFGEKGEEFDPNIHNASSKIDGDGDGKTIISDVYQKGYRVHDKLIRPAMVQVSG